MPPERADPPSPVLTCLIADDSEQIRTALKEVLGSAGVRVVGQAASGAEAVRLLERHLPTVMILDLRLGESSGLELAQTAAQVAPETAVILYTTYAGQRTISNALAAGVRAVVFKQASPTRLLSALQDIAAGRLPVDDPGSPPVT